MAGLTDDGLIIKTQPEIQAEFLASHRANVSEGIEGTADSLVGNYDAILSDQLASVWELAEDVWTSGFPNLASGFSLSQLVQLTRSRRRDPTASEVPVSVNVDPGTYPPGTLVAIVSGRPDIRFSNNETLENASAFADDIATSFVCEATGPISAPTGTLTIGEFVTGWNSITQSVDATLGLGPETDPELRVRREAEVSQGSATADAVRAGILRANAAEGLGITSVRVLFNDLDTVDANGVPGHAIEVIVNGPAAPTEADDLRLAELIAALKGDGIRAYGLTETITITDDQGNETNIGFSRATLVPIYLDLSLDVDAGTYAGDAAVKAAVVALNPSYLPDTDVYFIRVACVAFTVRGVLNVADGSIGIAPVPVTQTPIVIGIREIAVFDTSRITVTV